MDTRLTAPSPPTRQKIVRDLPRAGLILVLAWVTFGAVVVHGTGDDWRIFWNAGHHLGNLTLLTQSHFVYTPGSALLLWPFAQLSRTGGYFVYVLVMVGLTAGAAWYASKIYRLSFALTAFMALAWFPFTIAISLGQNSPIALFLTMLVIFAVTTRNDALAGVGTSLLLYKPNDAVPFLVLFVILRQWRPIVVVLASTPIWYLFSVAATGDWAWPSPFYHTLVTWFRWDASVDAVFSINIPGLLLSLGSSSTVAVLVGGIVFLIAMAMLLGTPRREAASIAPLIGIACSPHAYGYEAILVLPAFWLLVSRPSPLRISGVLLSYCIAPLYYFARAMHFDILAIPILGTLAAWLVMRLHDISARTRSPV